MLNLKCNIEIKSKDTKKMVSFNYVSGIEVRAIRIMIFWLVSDLWIIIN